MVFLVFTETIKKSYLLFLDNPPFFNIFLPPFNEGIIAYVIAFNCLLGKGRCSRFFQSVPFFV